MLCLQDTHTHVLSHTEVHSLLLLPLPLPPSPEEETRMRLGCGNAPRVCGWGVCVSSTAGSYGCSRDTNQERTWKQLSVRSVPHLLPIIPLDGGQEAEGKEPRDH